MGLLSNSCWACQQSSSVRACTRVYVARQVNDKDRLDRRVGKLSNQMAIWTCNTPAAAPTRAAARSIASLLSWISTAGSARYVVGTNGGMNVFVTNARADNPKKKRRGRYRLLLPCTGHGPMLYTAVCYSDRGAVLSPWSSPQVRWRFGVQRSPGLCFLCRTSVCAAWT